MSARQCALVVSIGFLSAGGQPGSLARAQPAGAGAFGLGQVMSAPFPSSLTAAPTGRAVAWVFDDNGKRNVWIADGQPPRARRLTSYVDDDGQEILDVRWTPDASAIVYVRGGNKNSDGEVPNPTNDPAGIDQEVWIAPLLSSVSRRLGPGHSPAVAPVGGRVAFIHDDEVWVAPLSSGSNLDPGSLPRYGSAGTHSSMLVGPHPHELTLRASALRVGSRLPPRSALDPGSLPRISQRLFAARGRPSSLVWAPDGSALAFVSTRQDHSFIGIFRPGQPEIEYVSPSVDRDTLPRWSPDGLRLAFLRQANVDTSASQASNVPWSVMVATRPSTGARFATAYEAWRAPDRPDGSFARMVTLLEWMEGNRLVFASEHEGWAHLYATDGTRANAPATALSSGACEVEEATPSADRRALFFTSNCGDIDRRHIWKVEVAASGRPAPQQLTPGAGIEFSPRALADGRTLAFLKADWRRPAMPFALPLTAPAEPTPLAPDAIPTSFPSAQLVEPKQSIFKAADGWDIHGQIFEPPARPGAPAKRPAIVFMHGGPPRQMLLGWHYMYYYHNTYAMNQYLASRGYVVLSVNFRSGIGYGRRFREAPGRGALGASEYQDIVAAAHHVRARPDVDPARIGLWGGSYGGYLTALGLARNSDLFAAGVDIHGVHDWSVFRRFNLGPSGSPDSVRTAREASPVASIDTWRSPVLLIHGDDDRNVDFSQTVDLVRLLRKHQVPFEQIVYPDEVHDFLLHRHWVELLGASAEFFDRKLGGRGRTPSLFEF